VFDPLPERRRSPRVAILGRLHGLAVALDVPVEVRDLSLGGISIDTPVPFPVGATQEFGLVMGDGSQLVLHGRILRCRDVSRVGIPMFQLGVQFLEDQDPTESVAVGQILERLD
jgi:hypothetical protein